MTSQLNVDTIVDKAGSGGTNVKVANNAVAVAEGGAATTNVVQGLAKAWGHFEGGDTTLDDSLNTTSLLDHGSGDFKPNFGNNMASINYAGAFHATDTGIGSAVAGGYVTNGLRFYIRTSAFGLIDKDDTTYIVNGDLA